MINPAQPNYLNTPVHPSRPHYAYSPADISTSAAVTLITPFYNANMTIFADTTQSVLRQSFQQWEWLIINDGSNDPDTSRGLDAYRTLDSRIRVIDHPHHKGLSAARNTGFRIAQTPYVVQIDQDDLLEPTVIEKWFWFLQSYPQFAFVKSYELGFGAEEYLWSKGFSSDEALLQNNRVTPISMIRADVHGAAGGYDESLMAGLENWDFWLRCANQGYWGDTIPEHLVWHRRRLDPSDGQANWTEQDQETWGRRVEEKYPDLYSGHFPKIEKGEPPPYATVSTALPCQNLLAKPNPTRRILIITPWLVVGGSDTATLHVVAELTARKYEITICTTLPSDNPWLAEFARFTPDIFNLPNFLKRTDYPRFLLYLIRSRQIDMVFITHSYLGYQLLPFLRAYCPELTFVDYSHIEMDDWRNGGYPRAAVGYQDLLDLSLTSTDYLKKWMIQRGGDPARIETCYTNIDPEQWNPAYYARSEIRAELGISLETPLMLYVGRIREQKRPQVFAEVIRRLAHIEKLTFTSLVIGEGQDLPWLQAFVQQHQLEPYVRFLGTVSLTRLQALMAAADIFFLPSQNEGISVALYEALAMHMVPVGADVGGQKELVTPECGYLIRHSDNELEEYVAALKALIESLQKRQAMAAAGRERIVKHFRLDQMTERLVNLLDKAEHLAKTSRRRAVDQRLGLEWATLAVEYTRLDSAVEHYRYRISQLAATEQELQRQVNPSSSPYGGPLSEQDVINRLSGEDISQRIPIGKLIKAVGFKIAAKPGFSWLYQFIAL